MLPQVERGDLRQDGANVAGVQRQMAVATALDVGERFQAGRGGHQHGWGGRQPGAHHGHVAGMVDHALLLLERGFVLLIHHDQA